MFAIEKSPYTAFARFKIVLENLSKDIHLCRILFNRGCVFIEQFLNRVLQRERCGVCALKRREREK